MIHCHRRGLAMSQPVHKLLSHDFEAPIVATRVWLQLRAISWSSRQLKVATPLEAESASLVAADTSAKQLLKAPTTGGSVLFASKGRSRGMTLANAEFVLEEEMGVLGTNTSGSDATSDESITPQGKKKKRHAMGSTTYAGLRAYKYRQHRVRTQCAEEEEEMGKQVVSEKVVQQVTSQGYRFLPALMKFLEPIHPDDKEKVDPPELAHGLHHVLNCKGVVPFRDPQTKKAQFDEFLTQIPAVEDTIWSAIPDFVRPSEDQRLLEVAQWYNSLKKRKDSRSMINFVASTSSTTQGLIAVYLLISGFRDPRNVGLRTFAGESLFFARYTYKPVMLCLSPMDDTVFAVDHEKEFDKENVLSRLGHSMERMLTTPASQFVHRFVHRRSSTERLFQLAHSTSPADNGHVLHTSGIPNATASSATTAATHPAKLSTGAVLSEASDLEYTERHAYSYARSGNFLFRAQLDCMDKKTGRIFDLKTRASVAIRLDVEKYKRRSRYRIDRILGRMNSFEKEYFDLIRSALIKYAFQLRIGRMHGAFLAFHNTKEMFGFEYVPLSEIHQSVFGSDFWGKLFFDRSMQLYNEIMDHALTIFPNRDPKDSLRIAMCVLRNSNCLHVYVNRIPHGREDHFALEGFTKTISNAFHQKFTKRLSVDRFVELVDAVPMTADISYLGLDKSLLRGFVVETKSFVDGKQVASINDTRDGAKYDVAYRFTPLPRIIPCRVFLQVWSEAYGICALKRKSIPQVEKVRDTESTL